MTQNHFMASAFALAALICACGGDPVRIATAPAPEEPETAVSSLSPDPSLADVSDDPGEGDCPSRECPDIMLFGSLAPGCCRGVEACGGRVRLGQSSWWCAPPEYDRTAEALRSSLGAHAGEPLVPDSSCPSQTFDGATLPGCCMPGGTCGVSTEPWTAAATGLGLRLPSVCITAREAAEIAGAAAADAGTDDDADAGSAPACAAPD